MASEKGGFSRVYQMGLGRLKVSLRRQQIELAKTGNPTMLIWLGKQLLEQRDKSDATNQVTVKEAVPRKLTPEDEAFLKRKAGFDGGGWELKSTVYPIKPHFSFSGLV